MFAIKGRKQSDQFAGRDIAEKRDRSVDRGRQSASSSPSSRNNSASNVHDFHPDELPDGACIAPLRVVTRDTECTAVREAAYIGSFAVLGTEQAARTEYVRQQLEEMRNVTKSKSILLVISLSGVKVCSSNGDKGHYRIQSVYMAHAMKRISYATCDPEFCQFSFLAREPKGQMNVQYCHAFITESPEQAEELNTIVGNAFKMAYASQRKKQPTFNELIEEQLKRQKAKQEETEHQAKQDLTKRLSLISTPTAADMANTRREAKKQQSIEIEAEKEANRVVGKNKVWAKQAVPKQKHRAGLPDGSSESPPPPLLKQIELDPPRSYGSPVVSLKESIDNQETLAVHHRLASPSQSFDFTNDRRQSHEQSSPVTTRHRHSSDKQGSPKGTEKRSSPHGTEKRSSPLGSKERGNGSPLGTRERSSPIGTRERRTNGHANREEVECIHPTLGRKGSDPVSRSSSKHTDMSNRPLPAPPDKEQTHSDGSRPSSGQQDNYRRSSSDPVVPLTLRHGEGRSASPSGNQRYQNDSSLRRPENGHDAPPLPTRLDSLRRYDGAGPLDDSTLRQASWYQAGIPREIALEILSQEEIGSFIVRDSTTHPGCFALSVKVPKFDNPTGISHYLITRTSRGGYRLKGLEKEWPSLMALVIHHTVMQEMLPCTLQLPRNTANPAYNETERDEKDEDEDYQRLSDFTSMMADLKMDN
ncbi:tensin homolog isoform X2 [Lineus longissimus]|uniref:tensin homolog isoform X2 n=1 Tax=Lineus longissimus TaxID=88925 RepID=UPI00315D299B